MMLWADDWDTRELLFTLCKNIANLSHDAQLDSDDTKSTNRELVILWF